ncbi:MAG: hypothetical protein GY801_09815 [bacterium]|nr:hypothetical protein [bacterium]
MRKIAHAAPEDRVINPWDMQLPPILLHFAPIALAVFCVTLSLADYSVFIGFEEHEAGTTMSLWLMFVCFLLTLSAMRNPALERSKRWIAGGLTLCIALAMADERLGFHEAFGTYIRRNVRFLSKKITHYTDDIVILAGAVAGILLLYYCIKYFSDKPDIWQYLWWVGLLAVAHGVLDLISHKRYVWMIFWPDLAQETFNFIIGEFLGCFEEWCKLWTEWFVILFLLRFFFKQKGSLVWSAQIFGGSVLATLGIWNVTYVKKGIPYILTGKPLQFIRNYHLLLCLITIWVAWGIITWIVFQQEPVKRTIAGLFFVCPFYVFLEEMIDKNLVDGFFHLLSRPEPFEILYAANTLVFLLIVCLLLLPGIVLGVFGGVFFPLSIRRLLKGAKQESFLLLGLILLALWLNTAFALVVCLMFALLTWLQRTSRESFLLPHRIRIVGASMYSMMVLVILWLHPPTLIPNVRFSPPPQEEVFMIGEQPIAHLFSSPEDK